MYSGKDIRTGKGVALKIARQSRCDLELQHEYQIYKETAGGPGIPRVFWCGREASYLVLVIERFQLSLEDLAVKAPVDVSRVSIFAPQMASTVQNSD